MEKGNVTLEVENNIGTITFTHPQSNTLPSQLLELLTHTLTNAGKDDSIKVIILKSGGNKAFCAGANFDELISISDFEMGHNFFLGFANVINAIRLCPKLVIGRVQGKTVGGGVGLAAAADYCLACTSAMIKLSELTIGIGPFVIAPVVERKIGFSALSQLTINATEWKNPEWAKSKGLYAEVYETTDELDEAVNKLAVQLSRSNPEAMRSLKKMFWKNTENWNELLSEQAAISGKLVLSDFSKKAIENFKSKMVKK
ncbi:enoyl-CoA hydratase/isomerase family protein [Reichenbachiella sp. MALMAid0571]|uniref:enoyl-CoA hydratase/isomerase family protein n=1 Tax=Reichenbachiella sp. MALMAid0571 TaxID=3143939 RepID=UPI0032DE72D8